MTDVRPLTDLLGDSRAQIAELLQSRPMTATEVAEHLQITPAAARRHLGIMQSDGIVTSEVVRDGSMGRPHERWSLDARGRRLFADRSAEFAGDLLDHVEATYGRGAVLAFLKQRAAGQVDRYADAIADADADDPVDRARRLAAALSADGFAARVEDGDDGRSLTLLQSHCAIEGIAREHPEVCAHEAASFKRLLGMKVSRRETIASGSSACVCHVELPDPAASPEPSPATDSDRS